MSKEQRTESEDMQEARQFGRMALWLFAGLLLVISLFSIIWFIGSRTVQTADNAIVHYEEFQRIYNATQALNEKLCTMNKIPETDVMFKDFSKAAQMNGLRNNLNRWIQEYNAKSNMWNRSLWKSKELPYELKTSDFSCY
jgi:hypothetical protein